MIEWVNKRKGIVVCTECGGSGKMLDEWMLKWSLGMTRQLKPCWVCNGAGTLLLKVPTRECKDLSYKPKAQKACG